MAAPLSLVVDRDLARGDTTNLCMGAIAEDALRTWARLQIIRGMIDKGQVLTAAATIALTERAAGSVAEPVRRVAGTAIRSLRSQLDAVAERQAATAHEVA